MIFIYTLSDPQTGYVRYVGVTNSPGRRLEQHFSGSDGNLRKSCWVAELSQQWMVPLFEIVDSVEESEWAFWEQFYVGLFRSWGFELFNKDSGGKGGRRKGLGRITEKNKLKEWLEQNERTGAWVARKSGLDRSTVARYVNNASQPDAPTMMKIAKSIGAKLEDLI